MRLLHPTRRFARNALVLALALAPAFLAACGGDESSAGEVGETDRDASAPAPVATDPENVFDTDLLVACDGVGYPAAAPYTATAGVIHPVLVLEGEATSMHSRSGAVRDAWTRTWTQENPTGLTEIELVACAERTAARKVEDCTGYQDDGVDTGNVVELMETDYAVTLHEAHTGREVAATTMTMLDDECPTFVMFSEGETTRPWYSFDSDAISAFVEPHVTP